MTDPKPATGDEGQQQELPGLLYHYTDQRGLHGILNDGSVWATHVLYLNDASELIAAWATLQERVKSAVSQSTSNRKEQLEKIFDRFLNVMWGDPKNKAIYVWCLTNDEAAIPQGKSSPGDRLSQWRAYSHNGHGYSLGFDSSLLRESFSRHPDSLNVVFDLGPCEYDESLNAQRLSAIADKHLGSLISSWNKFRNELREPNNPIFDDIKKHRELLLEPLVQMYMDFAEAASYMKHPGFSEEKEWRFVFVTENEKASSFRESHFGLTPFISVNLDLTRIPSALKRITVGPTAHKEQAVEAVEMLLRKREIEGVDVKLSNIPYRNW
ncbi:MAG: DUF2971 domain-containing protein [Terracidiphilus sp.]